MFERTKRAIDSLLDRIFRSRDGRALPGSPTWGNLRSRGLATYFVLPHWPVAAPALVLLCVAAAWFLLTDCGVLLILLTVVVLITEIAVWRVARPRARNGWCLIDVDVLIDNYQRLQAAAPKNLPAGAPRATFIHRGRVEPCGSPDVGAMAAGDPRLAWRRIVQQGNTLYCDDFLQPIFIVGDAGVALVDTTHVEIWHPSLPMRDGTEIAIHPGDIVTVHGRGHWAPFQDDDDDPFAYPPPLARPAGRTDREVLIFASTLPEPVLITPDQPAHPPKLPAARAS